MRPRISGCMLGMMTDNLKLFKLINDNPSLKKQLSDKVFSVTYNTDGKPFEGSFLE
ncbi:MAG: hypothetical protein FWH15_09890 [Betaproteobacteria bacterium]|nr:hypothetical protein [Betaproteobacteria bacterium]